MKDYVANSSVNLIDHTYITPSKNGCTPNTFPYIASGYTNASYIEFLANVSTISEPQTYEQEKGSTEWQLAMKQELEALCHIQKIGI